MGSERERVEHLLLRAGFGTTPAEVERWSTAGWGELIESLLAAPDEPETIAPPEWRQPFDPTRLIDQQAYWIHRMATTRFPLAEKMTLFYHGHFATGVRKVGNIFLMVRQNELFRARALGSFPALLREVARDGAMLVWLDGAGSHRKSPNENYAREVMELFTTGPGVYTESDIAEAARAFTGWVCNRKTGEVRFVNARHDGGVKSVLGRSGRFGADDVADILSALPETARFLAAKLWRFFASPVPDGPTVSAMAEAYLASGGEMRAVLRTLFAADAFYRDAVRGSLVRSPADLVASTYRVMGFSVGREAGGATTRMGHSLFDPPNVAGWPGGAAWLGASTLLARWNLGEAVKGRMGQRPGPGLEVKGESPEQLLQAWQERLGIPRLSETSRSALLHLLGSSLPSDRRAAWSLSRDLVRALIAAPEYQTV